jgi:adenylate kinase
MRILVSGPPLAGKTRQGGNLAEALGVPHVSSGGLIREAAATGDPAAMRLLGLVSDGTLAPSDAITRLVMARLAEPDCREGFVLDGFPRRLPEAEALLDNHVVDALFVLEAPADVLFERLRYRASQGRADDDPSTLPRRILAFEIETRPAHALLSDAGVPYCRVDATGEPDEISRAILNTLPTRAAIPCFC